MGGTAINGTSRHYYPYRKLIFPFFLTEGWFFGHNAQKNKALREFLYNLFN
jgi:hypothetical protein